jgi:hypothetical protein
MILLWLRAAGPGSPPASYLVLLSRGQVKLAGDVSDLLAADGQASLEQLAMAYLRESKPAVTR